MKKERSRKYRLLQAFRISSQAVFFGIFAYLFVVSHYTGQDDIGRTVERFFHFDPLIALTTLLSSRTFFLPLALAGATVLVTVILGRVVCGWICPLGAVHQFFSFLFKKAKILRPKREENAPLFWKYVLLVFILIGAIFTLNVAGLLDPLSLLYRSFAIGLFPALSYVFSGLAGLLYALRVDSAAQALSQFLGNLVLNAIFRQGLLISLVFGGIVALNAWKERFWCRYVCPLGALLALFSRWNIFKLKIDDDACIRCGLCTTHCETQAAPFPNEAWRSPECIYCGTCAAVCPTAAISFQVKAHPEKIKTVDLSRRKLIMTTALGALAAPFFRIAPSLKRPNSKLIRPPGALAEEAFLRKCVKCGECLKVCPTNGLQPAWAEAGPEGLWTPVLVPVIGYCEYYCSLCTQVCPTGALKELRIEEKTSFKIGSSWINNSRCIPYALGKPCIVCEEHCPTSPKAIKLIMAETARPDGMVVVQKAPVIDQELCIGCGICENKCPVVDGPAIYVTSIGEQRSTVNRLLLPVLEDDPSG